MMKPYQLLSTLARGSADKNPPAMQETQVDTGSVPGLRRVPGEGNGNPLQCSCLERPWTEEPGGCRPQDCKGTQLSPAQHAPSESCEVRQRTLLVSEDPSSSDRLGLCV